MRFAGAPTWDSAAGENTIGFDGALLFTAQNRCSRQKVFSNNRSARSWREISTETAPQ
jgi:hypothetical protein